MSKTGCDWQSNSTRAPSPPGIREETNHADVNACACRRAGGLVTGNADLDGSPALACTCQAEAAAGTNACGRGNDLDGVLPAEMQWKTHNYNHLMEQPTIFYALVGIFVIGGATPGIDLCRAAGSAFALAGRHQHHSHAPHPVHIRQHGAGSNGRSRAKVDDGMSAQPILLTVVALAAWTMVMWAWLYVTRISAQLVQGVYGSLSPALILELLNGGLSMRKTADRLGISLSTVQRVKIENRLVVGVNDR